MSGEVRIFVNGKGYLVPAGSTVREGISRAEPSLLASCETGDAVLTDARGLPLALDALLEAGAILRAAPRHRRGSDAGALDA
ncbi:MAG TPA: hypothetical protein VMG41_17625 [Gemmatimonadales bacterium]|nr:hypothetical protein [Gemmatimonadales bacterium]